MLAATSKVVTIIRNAAAVHQRI